MGKQIKTIYVIHHSHTDIGYTDLQERIIDVQARYIADVVKIMSDPKNKDFRWNCETYFCIEKFFEKATNEQKESFFKLLREDKVGLSANYFNFNELASYDVLSEKLDDMVSLMGKNGIVPNSAMFADINGISIGQRDAMIEHGVEFLYTNIHCHHGMYPLYQNQQPFFWENDEGKKMLVFSGEHYNLGNVLGIKPNPCDNYMTNLYGKNGTGTKNDVDILNDNVIRYIDEVETNGYKYDFIIASCSGAFTDNAPPSLKILETINAYTEKYPENTKIKMVTLSELYSLIKDKVADAPTFRGALPDWWTNGVNAAPHGVKHYKDAVRKFNLAKRLDKDINSKFPKESTLAKDNMLLYAEHTAGHSATVTDPFETMVENLSLRKDSYASKSHEYATLLLDRISEERGDIMQYYNTTGEILVTNPSKIDVKVPVEFYIETCVMKNAEVINKATGEKMTVQISAHPRGKLISFVDTFKKGESKTYSYREIPEVPELINSRIVYTGTERVRDIVNDYDSETYKLPYRFENKFFLLTYNTEDGFTSFINKTTGLSMLDDETIPFFTPIYERTDCSYSHHNPASDIYEERRLLGRNIRGQYASLFKGKLKEISVVERGPIFTTLRFDFDLEGTIKTQEFVKFYNDIPKIDFRVQLGKTLSTDIESIFMPLTVSLPSKKTYIKNGSKEFMPGVEQLPGSNMEYYGSEIGVAYTSDVGSVLVSTPDTLVLYMGEMKHHPIKLCDNKAENNLRPVYSWIMNNCWETNFNLSLAGFYEFNYSLTLSPTTDRKQAIRELEEMQYKPFFNIIK